MDEWELLDLLSKLRMKKKEKLLGSGNKDRWPESNTGKLYGKLGTKLGKPKPS